ncbi:hypothetical protein [Nannocystis pusilla]|uniref:hypothetical protein n=1 Tax=Nannocystis pusilla TaxID=889268 RepID=UPI003BF446E2
MFLFEHPKATLVCAFALDVEAGSQTVEELKFIDDNGYDPHTGAPADRSMAGRSTAGGGKIEALYAEALVVACNPSHDARSPPRCSSACGSSSATRSPPRSAAEARPRDSAMRSADRPSFGDPATYVLSAGHDIYSWLFERYKQ